MDFYNRAPYLIVSASLPFSLSTPTSISVEMSTTEVLLYISITPYTSRDVLRFFYCGSQESLIDHGIIDFSQTLRSNVMPYYVGLSGGMVY